MEKQRRHRLLSWVLALSVALSFFAIPRNAHAEIGAVVSEMEQAIDTLSDTDPTADAGLTQTDPSQTGSVSTEAIPSASYEILNDLDAGQAEMDDTLADQQADPTEDSQDAPPFRINGGCGRVNSHFSGCRPGFIRGESR